MYSFILCCGLWRHQLGSASTKSQFDENPGHFSVEPLPKYLPRKCSTKRSVPFWSDFCCVRPLNSSCPGSHCRHHALFTKPSSQPFFLVHLLVGLCSDDKDLRLLEHMCLMLTILSVLRRTYDTLNFKECGINLHFLWKTILRHCCGASTKSPFFSNGYPTCWTALEHIFFEFIHICSLGILAVCLHLI